jgi:MFS family permease
VRDRNFLRLWAATTIDSFGTWLLLVAVPLQIFRLTGSATSTALALAVSAAPAVLIGPWAGRVIDRWNRKGVLVIANLAGAAGVALMLVGTPGWIYAGLVVENVAVCFLRPALIAVLPSVVADASALAAANALTTFTSSLFRLIGPLLGTFLAARGWFPAVVVVDVASYLIAAALLATVRMRPRFVERDRPEFLLRGLLIATFVFWTANGALTALLVPFAVTRLHSPGDAVGYLIAGLGVGYLCGAAISKRVILRYAPRTVLTVAYTVVGFSFLVAFTATSLPVALVAITVSGVPGAISQVAVRQTLQTRAPSLGRAAAALTVTDALAAVVGALLAAAFPVPVAYAALVLVSAVVAYALVNRNTGMSREVLR